MKLTKNSWHYNAYLFLTGKTPNNNFCDYFWELLFNLIFFIPNLPFYLTTMIYSKVEKANKITNWNENNHYWNTEPKNYAEKLQDNNKIPLYLKIIASIFISFVLYVFFYFIINDTLNFLKGLGLVLLIILLIIAFLYIVLETHVFERIKDNIVELFSMIKEAFIAFKNNYCPKIDWTDKY